MHGYTRIRYLLSDKFGRSSHMRHIYTFLLFILVRRSLSSPFCMRIYAFYIYRTTELDDDDDDDNVCTCNNERETKCLRKNHKPPVAISLTASSSHPQGFRHNQINNRCAFDIMTIQVEILNRINQTIFIYSEYFHCKRIYVIATKTVDKRQRFISSCNKSIDSREFVAFLSIRVAH